MVASPKSAVADRRADAIRSQFPVQSEHPIKLDRRADWAGRGNRLGVELVEQGLPTWSWQGLAWDRIRGGIPITVELRRPRQGEHPVSPTDPEFIFRHQGVEHVVETSDHDLSLVVANRRNTSAAGQAEAFVLHKCQQVRSARMHLSAQLQMPRRSIRSICGSRYSGKSLSMERAGNFETDAVAKTTSCSLDVLDIVLRRRLLCRQNGNPLRIVPLPLLIWLSGDRHRAIRFDAMATHHTP